MVRKQKLYDRALSLLLWNENGTPDYSNVFSVGRYSRVAPEREATDIGYSVPRLPGILARQIKHQ